MSDAKQHPGREKYSHIFEPRPIGPFTSKNRVKYAACSVSNFNHRDGSISERELARMEVVARTGCGIITNQGVYPDPRGEGKAYFRQLALHDDRYVEGLARVCDMIHAQGAIAIQQILHGGRYGGIDLDYCLQPSATPQSLRHFRPPREVTGAEIKQTIEDHADAARRCIEAGYDGVEITAFKGYLLADFLSPYTNQRTDPYGGSVANRARFMVELLQAVRAVIGADKLLIVRLNAVELMDEHGGSTPDECIEHMKIAERDADVDMISVVIGWHEARFGALDRDLPIDAWVGHAKRVKEAVDVPVAFGVQLRDPVLANRLLGADAFDFWEVCRPFLADPELLHKVEADRLDELKPCVAGLDCLARMFRNLPYHCTVNPRLGHEYESAYEVTPTAHPKRVMVVGGGVAGLECAVTAAERGHDVTVYERRNALGGQLLMADREISRGKSYRALVKQYATRADRLGVTIELETCVDRKLVVRESPDVLVVATGAEVPRLNGTPPDQGLRFVSLEEALIDDTIVPAERVVIISGRRAGLVCAEFLASKGCKVRVVEPSARYGSDVSPALIGRHRAWIRDHGIEVLTEHHLVRHAGGMVTLAGPDGQERRFTTDVLIQAGPRRSRQELANDAYLADELYLIGDAVKPRSIAQAIQEGFQLGVRI